MTTTQHVKTLQSDQAVRPPRKFAFIGRSAATLWANWKSRLGLIILAFFILVAIFAPVLAPYGASQDGFPRNADSSPEHWFGTTAAGEDVLSQLIYGSQISVTVGFIAGILSTIVAVLIGLSWGYIKGFGAEVVNFIVNLFLVVPGLPLMIDREDEAVALVSVVRVRDETQVGGGVVGVGVHGVRAVEGGRGREPDVVRLESDDGTHVGLLLRADVTELRHPMSELSTSRGDRENRSPGP